MGAPTSPRVSISYLLDGETPNAVELMAIDPRDPLVVYLRASRGEQQALVRSPDAGLTYAEILRQAGVMASVRAKPGHRWGGD